MFFFTKLAFVFLLENLSNQFREREREKEIDRCAYQSSEIAFVPQQQQQQREKKNKREKTFLHATSLKRDRQQKPPK